MSCMISCFTISSLSKAKKCWESLGLFKCVVVTLISKASISGIKDSMMIFLSTLNFVDLLLSLDTEKHVLLYVFHFNREQVNLFHFLIYLLNGVYSSQSLALYSLIIKNICFLASLQYNWVIRNEIKECRQPSQPHSTSMLRVS